MSRSTKSEGSGTDRYFCDEPWTGVFAIEVNQDVTFCPCYLKLTIGNLAESSIQEIWNAEELLELRRQFDAGILPHACADQLCPVVLREPGASSRSTGQGG